MPPILTKRWARHEEAAMDMFISVVAMVFFALVRLSTNTASHVFVHYVFCFYQQIWRPPKRCTFVFFDYKNKFQMCGTLPANLLC